MEGFEAPDRRWNAQEEEPAVEEDQDRVGEVIRNECLEKFASKDYIMEPGIFLQLKRYFQAGGNPEQVVDLLLENYQAVAQTANLLAEWLIMAGMNIAEVQSIVEDHLKQMIIKHFDPRKADTIFTVEGETPAWLTEMIEHPTWRSLIYTLAEEYPDCLMLNFTIKLISDAGFQGEITSISTASQQLEVFSRILKTCITNFLEGGEESMEKNFKEFTKIVCHGEHTYLYTQSLLRVLSQEAKGGANIKRLSQEISRYAQKSGHNPTPINMALKGVAAYHAKACTAISAMLSKNALNPADISVLYNLYQSENPAPPPVELIREPAFLDLLLDALFRPGSRLNPEHKPKYIFLLAYSASCYDVFKRGTHKVRGKAGADTLQQQRAVNKEELKKTQQAIEKMHSICNEKKGSSELLPELNTMFQCMQVPVLALAVVHWVSHIVLDPTYFSLCTEHTPLHLALLDEVVMGHATLHQKVLQLLIKLFESPMDELDVLVQLDIKKMLLDRMVHVFSRGCVIPVLTYITQCWQHQNTDVSLIRYFVSEILEVIAPPYSPDLVQLFLPLVDNDEISGSMRDPSGSDAVSQFIVQAKTMVPT